MLQMLKEQLGNPADLYSQKLNNGYWEMELVYFPALCDDTQIKDGLIVPYTYRFDPDEFRRMLKSHPKFGEAGEQDDWCKLVLNGAVLFRIEDQTYVFEAARKMFNAPDKAQVEAALQGPQSALTEDLDLNLNLLRNRYNRPSLSVEEHIKGTASTTRLSIIYDRERVNRQCLNDLYNALAKVKIQLLQSAGQLSMELTGRRHRLFPTMLITERVDRLAIMLQRGKIVIIIDGNRFALLLPVRLFDFMNAMDDDYEPYWMSRFLLVLRYICLVITLTLPALYVSFVSYNPEVLRVQLTLSIAGSRVVVPYPSFIEVLIMLFMIETLTEASLRLPRYIGSTAATVGGLILGQAVQQAGLVSSIMIIVTSVVAISNFVIPNTSFSYSVRFTKYLFLAVSIFYGLMGVVVLFFMLIVYMCNLRSFGQPYLALFIPKNEAMAHHER